MKIEVKYIPSEEKLLKIGNKFFTQEQVNEIREA